MKKRLPVHDSWATPTDLYDQLNAYWGFGFDPCPYNPSGITEETDGLLKDWDERTFLNPPYSRKLKEAFVKKAANESKKGKLVVLLLPVSTSTSLFHNIIKPNAKHIEFVRGRIKFKGINSFGVESTGAGMHDSMIVIFDGRNLNMQSVAKEKEKYDYLRYLTHSS